MGGPHQGLAYKLADKGYDVWMGNFRGNRYSREHIYLNPNEQPFWNFSFHELGVQDLPSMIDYIGIETGHFNIHYVGHSQGTTTFLVMCAELPWYNSRMLSVNLMGPVAYYSHVPGVLFRSGNVILGYEAVSRNNDV